METVWRLPLGGLCNLLKVTHRLASLEHEKMIRTGQVGGRGVAAISWYTGCQATTPLPSFSGGGWGRGQVSPAGRFIASIDRAVVTGGVAYAEWVKVGSRQDCQGGKSQQTLREAVLRKQPAAVGLKFIIPLPSRYDPLGRGRLSYSSVSFPPIMGFTRIQQFLPVLLPNNLQQKRCEPYREDVSIHLKFS